jgi:putative ATP-dependent endonuclease of OLD family
MMIEQFDRLQGRPSLSSEYVSVVEVGGAYTHLFFGLLAFLEVPTLVLTDLDSAKLNANNRRVACRVSEGTHTTNACLTDWFDDPNISPAALLKKSPEEKTRNGCRLAYEVPESDDAPCGRSFEGAFMLANPHLFDLLQQNLADVEEIVWKKTVEVRSKALFALNFATKRLSVNKYINFWGADCSSSRHEIGLSGVGVRPFADRRP